MATLSVVELTMKLRDKGLIAMQPTGRYGLTDKGREFIDSIDVLRMLDDREEADRVEKAK
jgi:Mn-dependent DtxR family transcriptional regulator